MNVKIGIKLARRGGRRGSWLVHSCLCMKGKTRTTIVRSNVYYEIVIYVVLIDNEKITYINFNQILLI